MTGSRPRDLSVLGEVTEGMLGETFPRWRLYESRGLWFAVRDGAERLDGPGSLLRSTLAMRDLAGLAEALCVQERLDRLTPAELAAVWRDGALPLPSDVPLPMLVPDEP
jgi:hypothetical protein